MSDYRVKITIRNDRLLSKMEEMGFQSVSKFCKHTGMPYVNTNCIFNGRLSPIKENGDVKKNVKLLLENLDMTVEEAFTTRQLEGFSKNSFETKVKEKQLLQIINKPKNLEMKAIENDVKLTLSNIFSRYLSPRYEKVLRMRYGIGLDTEHTLEEVSLVLQTTRERVRQIELKAIEKLKQPEVMSQLINTGFSDVFTKVDLNKNHLEQNKKYLSNKIIKLKAKIKNQTGETIQ
jgi:RNA polymerase sigma factor (sigma-70 family)